MASKYVAMLDFAHSPSHQSLLTRRNHLFYRHLNPSHHTDEKTLMHKAGLTKEQVIITLLWYITNSIATQIIIFSLDPHQMKGG